MTIVERRDELGEQVERQVFINAVFDAEVEESPPPLVPEGDWAAIEVRPFSVMSTVHSIMFEEMPRVFVCDGAQNIKTAHSLGYEYELVRSAEKLVRPHDVDMRLAELDAASGRRRLPQSLSSGARRRQSWENIRPTSASPALDLSGDAVARPSVECFICGSKRAHEHALPVKSSQFSTTCGKPVTCRLCV